MRKLATAVLMAALSAGCVHKPARFEGQVFPESGTQVARAVGVALQFRGSSTVASGSI